MLLSWPQTSGKAKKDGEEAAAPPLVRVPNGKEQRMKDEEKMKVQGGGGRGEMCDGGVREGYVWDPFTRL